MFYCIRSHVLVLHEVTCLVAFLPKLYNFSYIGVVQVPSPKDVWSMGPDSVTGVNFLLGFLIAVLAASQKSCYENVI